MLEQLAEITENAPKDPQSPGAIFYLNEYFKQNSLSPVSVNPRRESNLDASQRSSRENSRPVSVVSNINAKLVSMVGLRSVLHPEEERSQSIDSGEAPSLSDLDGDILIRHLGMIEQKMFKEIPINEFFNQCWAERTALKAPNLQKLIQWFNYVALGIASEVVRLESIKDRVSLLKNLIATAHSCLMIANYNTCFEIVAGLNMASVSRLKKTWAALPKKSADSWEVLNTIVSNESI